MEPREKEQAIIDDCLRFTNGGVVPKNKTQADVCRYAAMLLATRHPEKAKRLWAAHEIFYVGRTEQPESYAKLRQHAGLSDLDRFRRMLEQRLREQTHAI